MSKVKQYPFRADHVGSLLRPTELLDIRKKFANQEVSHDDLNKAEDDAIIKVIKLQEEAGLHGITDGEFRRHSFHGDFIGKLQGVEFKQVFTPGEKGSKSSKAPFVAFVTDKLKLPQGGVESGNFSFVKEHTKRTPKTTIPSPTMLHFRGGREAIDKTAYPEMTDFFDGLVNVYRQEINLLGDAGCRYLHLDDTNLAYLCDPKMRADAEARGENVEALTGAYADLINRTIAKRHKDMVACIHLCRGNARSAWFASGGYEAIADKLFNSLDIDAYYLEYDDERSGGFEPLRFMPKDKKVVLGLISSKTGELENKDEIKRRIEDAAKFIPLEQLCLSPQCGFASVEEGNLLTEDDEKRKLSFVVEIADEVWGKA